MIHVKNLVSIIIPCYNAERWISATITSALNQTWRPIEIIVVDDGSTDSSLSVCKQFVNNPSFRLITQLKQGASAARNTGLRAANGAWIQFLDADDLIDANKISVQLSELLSTNKLLVASGKWTRFDKSIDSCYFNPEPVWSSMNAVDWLVCSWEGGGMMPIHSWLIPRKLCEMVGPWDDSLNLNDDGEYFTRILLASDGIKFCDEAISYYRSNITGSVSRLSSNAAYESLYRSIELMTKLLLKKSDTYVTRRACATVYQRFIYDVYPCSLNILKRAEKNVTQFGGTTLTIKGSKLFSFVSYFIGWKLARRLQRLNKRSN